ncbi:MAG: M67 family metallopeptidase [Sneathiella sp.]|nr:M67 family metallopeptidase [Sneathiella sp.]
MMKFILSSSQLEELRKHAIECMPEEACALLVGSRDRAGNWFVTSVVAADNIAENKYEFFEIDPGVRIRLERELREQEDEIIGVFHSHPGGRAEPSKSDERMIIERHLIWLVASIDEASSFKVGAYKAHRGEGFNEISLVVTDGK